MTKFLIIIVLFIIVAAGAWYFLSSREEAVPPAPVTGEVSVSDEVPALAEDLQATDIENLDKEFADIETELEGALQE